MKKIDFANIDFSTRTDSGVHQGRFPKRSQFEFVSHLLEPSSAYGQVRGRLRGAPPESPKQIGRPNSCSDQRTRKTIVFQEDQEILVSWADAAYSFQ